MSDTDNDVPAAVDAGDTEEAGDVIRPVTAGTDANDEGGAEEYAGDSRPLTAGDSNCAEGDDEPAETETAPSAVERPPSAMSESSKPGSARPTSARPSSATVNHDRSPSARLSSSRPASGRPPSARPPVSDCEMPATAACDKGDATDASMTADEGPAEDSMPVPQQGATEGACEGPGEDECEGAEKERPGSSRSHHADVITDIEQSPEARAEVDEMAQQQAREVIRSRQNSAGSERKASRAEEDRRPASGSNASVRSIPPSRQAAPPESIANTVKQPPSPSKVKTGPWLSGTYRLPKSGKIISGEELCEALERMTNAYIDNYTREKNTGLTKEIAPGAATVFNTKKLSQDEYDTMIARLYKPKERGVPDGDRIQLITLKFGEDGQEQWVPVKTVSVEEQQAYMCELYQRCLDIRKKTKEELAAKYLKPLGPQRRN